MDDEDAEDDEVLKIAADVAEVDDEDAEDDEV